MQRRELDGRAADLHRLEHRERIQHPGAADVHLNVVEPRLGDVRRELSRDRPARLATADDAQLVLQRERVDFHDAAIDREVELRADLRLDVVRPLRDVVERLAAHVMRCDRECPTRPAPRALRSASGREGTCPAAAATE